MHIQHLLQGHLLQDFLASKLPKKDPQHVVHVPPLCKPHDLQVLTGYPNQHQMRCLVQPHQVFVICLTIDVQNCPPRYSYVIMCNS